MDAFLQLMSSGKLSFLELVLIALVGLLSYFLTTRQKISESNLKATIDGMQTLLQEERVTTEKLSHTVYEIRLKIKEEEEKNFALKEEILILKQENMRLQNLVSQMEKLVQQYQEELKTLKQERGN